MATEAESGRVRVRVLQLQRYKYGSPSLKAGVPRSAPILFPLFLKGILSLPTPPVRPPRHAVFAG